METKPKKVRMEEDDDMIVVIVGNEDEGTKFQPTRVRQEVLEETPIEELEVEELIETVEKHGEVLQNFQTEAELEIKKELEESQAEFLDYEDDDDEYTPNANSDYVESEEEEEYIKISKRSKTRKGNKEERRYKMLKPSECKSFVKDLQQSYPELAEDSETLVETLAEIMRNVKAPLPPRDYFIMNGAMFECVKCGFISETQPAAGRHWQEKHGQRYLVCYACGVDFRSTTNLYKHEKRCRAVDAVVVLKARARSLGTKGRGRPFLPDPVEMKARAKFAAKHQFSCNLCAARFSSKTALDSHHHLHTGARPYACMHCRAKYTSKSALSRHLSKHRDVQFICDHCQRSFKLKAALASHMDTHNPTRKWGCEVCGRRYAQKMALQLHEDRVHRGLPPPCACQICPKRYPRMSLLKVHMLKEHGMNLVTRKMFFKLLPTLTKTKLDQAKIVFKSDHRQTAMAITPDQVTWDIKQEPAYDVDAPFLNTQDTYDSIQESAHDVELSHDTQNYDFQQDQCVEIRVQNDTDSNEVDIAEVLQYIQQLQEQGVDNKNVKVIYVQNGQIIGITDENSQQEGVGNVDESKGQENDYTGEYNEQEKNSHKGSNSTEYENVIVEQLISGNDNAVDRSNVLREPMPVVKSIMNVEDCEESDNCSNMKNALRQDLKRTKRK